MAAVVVLDAEIADLRSEIDRLRTELVARSEALAAEPVAEPDLTELAWEREPESVDDPVPAVDRDADVCPRPERVARLADHLEGRRWVSDGPTPFFSAWQASSGLLGGKRHPEVHSDEDAVFLVNEIAGELSFCGPAISNVQEIQADPIRDEIIACFEEQLAKAIQVYNARPVEKAGNLVDALLAGLTENFREQGDTKLQLGALMEYALLQAKTGRSSKTTNALNGIHGLIADGFPCDLLALCVLIEGQARGKSTRQAAREMELRLLSDLLARGEPGFEDSGFIVGLLADMKADGARSGAMDDAIGTLNREQVWPGMDLFREYGELVRAVNAVDPAAAEAAGQRTELAGRAQEMLCRCETSQAWDTVLDLLIRLRMLVGEYSTTIALFELREMSRGAAAEGELAELEADAIFRLALKRQADENDPRGTLSLLRRAAERWPALKSSAHHKRALVLQSGPPERVLGEALAALEEHGRLPEELPPAAKPHYPSDFVAQVYELIAAQLDRIPQQDLAAGEYRRRAALARISQETP